MTHDPLAYVRALWSRYAVEGPEAVHAELGPDFEWEPLAWGRPPANEVTATVHDYEAHGDCVVAHGSLRIYRDHGLVDLQPSWVYFFRDSRLVRCAGYVTREEALRAIGDFRAAP